MKHLRWPRSLAGVACAAALVAAGVLPGVSADGQAAPGEPCGPTTLQATLQVANDGTLRCGPGRALHVRTDIAAAKAARLDTRSPLVSFLTLADLSIPDEESPLRAEFADACTAWPGSRSYRPHETMIPALVNAHVKAATALASNPTGSPLVHAPYSFAVQLGNGADNQHFNEVRTVIDLLDGGKVVNPDSGKDGYEGAQREDPTGGAPALTSPVQGSSLRDLGNEAFWAAGLRTVGGAPLPWVSVIGQHDVRGGGWMPADNPAWKTFANAFATGQLKINALGSDRLRRVCADPTLLSTASFWTGVAADPTVAALVTADASRRLLGRDEWVAEHSQTTGLPAGHGFGYNRCADAAGVRLARACYSWNQDPIHFVALDTAADTGTGAGDVDTAQLAWLERELVANSSSYVDADGSTKKTTNKNRLVVLFTNHASDTLTNESVPEGSAATAAQLEQLLLRFPNVILHVSARADRAAAVPHHRNGKGYWELQSTSVSAWPSQSRSIELADNHDGTLSIFGVLFDAAAPPNARALRWDDDATDERKQSAARSTNEDWIAAAAREIALHDPQRPAAPSAANANVELLLKHPWGVTKSRSVIVDPGPVPGGVPIFGPTVPSFPGNFPTGFPGGLPQFPANPPGFPGGQLPQQSPEEMYTGTKALAVKPTAGDGAYTSRVIILFITAAAGASWLVQARVRRWMVGI